MGITIFVAVTKLSGYAIVSYAILKFSTSIKEIAKDDKEDVSVIDYYIKPRIRR